MTGKRLHGVITAVSALAALVAVTAAALISSPTLVAWVRQPEWPTETDTIQALAFNSYETAVKQRVAGDRPIDAVGLILPTGGDTLDGNVSLSVVPEGSSNAKSTGASSTVNLSTVRDWQMHVFRLPHQVRTSSVYDIILTTDKSAYVAATNADAYSGGAIVTQAGDSTNDLKMRVYEDVGFSAFVRHVASKADTSPPAWLLVVAFLAAPMLMGAAIARMVLGESAEPQLGSTATHADA